MINFDSSKLKGCPVQYANEQTLNIMVICGFSEEAAKEEFYEIIRIEYEKDPEAWNKRDWLKIMRGW